MELGHASALGIPVFSSTPPSEPAIADRVTLISNPGLITQSEIDKCGKPAGGIERLQHYYSAAAKRRSWDHETVEETLTLLAGEVSELKTAIRKHNEGINSEDDRDADVPGELADVQLYLVHLANALNLDLSKAVNDKEHLNASRFESKRSVA